MSIILFIALSISPLWSLTHVPLLTQLSSPSLLCGTSSPPPPPVVPDSLTCLDQLTSTITGLPGAPLWSLTPLWPVPLTDMVIWKQKWKEMALV